MSSCGPNNGAGLLGEMKLLGEAKRKTSGRKMINSELWHACAGPLVSLPQPGSLVYYFPQGHSEQVTASTRKLANSQIPNYPSLPSQLLCQVHNVTLHADKDTDEIYAQITLQPVNSESDVFPIPDLGHTKSKHPTEFFCKNLTASDTSTHGGFSVPRRAAEKLFPQMDYSMQPPNQELVVRDLHENLWTFRHIYRGQPKRHLLTTGWSLFVGTKRLRAGDSVLFIRDEKSQLLLGIRRANRQQSALPSSVLSTDSMHIGVLAAAAHAAASKSPFTVYYNPRACPSDFIIPLIKYNRAVYTQVSIGMRFGMMFETEESCKRRYMGTIIGISDCDPTKWPNSKWRNLHVEWDEHGYGERPERVSLWEVETPESLFVSPDAPLSLKRQCLPGFVVPAVNIGFQDTEPLSADVRSDQLLELLNISQIGNLDTLPTYHPSIYASILQNARNSKIPRSCSSNLSTLCAMMGSTQQEVGTKTMMQQKHQFPPSQQLLLPSSQASTISQDFQTDYGLLSSMKSQDVGKDDSHPGLAEKNCQDNDEADDNRVNLQSEFALSEEISPEKSEIDSVMSTNELDKRSNDIIDRSCKVLTENKIIEDLGLENSGGPFGNENLSANVFANPKMEAKGQNDNQILDRQLEQVAMQSPGLATIEASERINPNNLLGCQGYSPSFLDHDDWFHQSSFQSFTGSPKTPEMLSVNDRQDFISAVENTVSSSADLSCVVNPQTLDSVRTCQHSSISDSRSSQYYSACVQELLATSELNPLQNEHVAQGFLLSQANNLEIHEKASVFQSISNPYTRRDLSMEINHYGESLNNLQPSSQNGNVVVCPVTDVAMNCYNGARSSNFLVPSEVPVCNPGSNDDFMPQIMTAGLLEHKLFSQQHITDSAGGASSGSIDTKECSLFRGSSKQSCHQPIRTYTKVQKLGSVGRSIDVTRFTNYGELKSAIACMFGLNGQLDDPEGSEWKLVYVDYENDVLLVGDDPWEEFVSCVRCIKILSPSEVQQMSQEGMQL